MTSQAQTLPAAQMPADEMPVRRKKLFMLLGGAIAAAAIGYGSYWVLVASHYVSTDNAYVAAEIAQVTPEVAGTVRTVQVMDTQHVKRGDILVLLNDSDARLALAQTQADLERAERRVRGFFANDAGLTAQVQARSAEQTRAAAQLASARSDLERAQLDFKRREALVKNGSVSAEELSNAKNALSVAEARYRDAEAAATQSEAYYRAAVEALKSNQTLTANTTVDTNPEVALARAKRDQARLDLARTVIRAPIDGVVAKRQVQVGQRVQAGVNLLSVVPLQQAHVDANFKEVQLEKVRLGQAVKLTSDLYGSKAVYHGKVVGLAGGSGSAFAMIPAQNATGNWIKVVQRLPVRIALDPAELKAHPLSVGLSMTATIDTRDN
ncbi:HlyD family secretion protein [Vogesella indigofera]|jgi:membrane fusion protein (multidrug efflux system)|uniref:Membrane fusion protein (Multidrug efflux system) n=1 Tax=Vogesella indigofera TaxID=45465 RepID=A0A495B398_VOGIN|nr:HlyD family efflux transporter periplasmic adaptor subunit [Vogesella indigofera]MDC7698535.1 HlyD family efflux transporter periplasmic adaptor subunit [Vogesella indigofera]RKQ55439.1 membrane fusion protein (multidrug efflux system) [Vogesella indigofera]